MKHRIQGYLTKILLEAVRMVRWRVGRPAGSYSDWALQDEGERGGMFFMSHLGGTIIQTRG